MFQKKILIILDRDNFAQEIKEWFLEQNSKLDNEFDFVFSDELEKIEQKILISDLVLNFSNPNFDFYKTIQERLEFLKINYFGNDFNTNKILNLKNNFKKIALQNNFKTPVFEKIGERKIPEIFQEFVLPARIYSKDNDFYSGKLESIKEIEEVFQNQGERIKNYFIEEFIEGKEYFIFAFRDFRGKMQIWKFRKTDTGLEIVKDELKDIEIKIREFIEKAELKSFALFDIIDSEKRGEYLLNLFVSNLDILEKREIFEQIFEILEINFPQFLFEKDLN